MENEIIKQVRKLLREYVDTHHDGVVRRAAKDFGMEEGALLNQWLCGQRTPSLKSLAPILEKMGVTLQAPTLDPVEYVMIPKVAARAGAGSSLITEDTVHGYYAFRREFFRREHICGDKSVLLDVLGDSMAPLILNHDTILVDQSPSEVTELRDGNIYLVGFGDELLVKRLQRTPRGWLLVSQNQDYAPISVEGPDLENFRVYGRVRWFGRVL
ncbi:S24 family peptidase [uncultured Desulfovibrio sp.]|uniref:S24 family peptidase n=1 Tax=uncultured Desulfovibrio sp. TaxID=167968 RepID=UPI0025876A82|nr:S24 family peptidase [uncultured Desulfovibrio sp.]